MCVCVCVCMPKEINIWNYSQVNERVHEFQIWTCDKCKLGQELTSGLGLKTGNLEFPGYNLEENTLFM